MVNEVRLEKLCLQWFAETGYDGVHPFVQRANLAWDTPRNALSKLALIKEGRPLPKKLPRKLSRKLPRKKSWPF